MGRDEGGGSTGRRRSRRSRAARACTVASTIVLLAGCGLGPFSQGGGADDSSALASAGPAVSSPEPAAESPLLSDELDPSSTVGMLAPGFPSDLLPVPPGAQVLVSSVDPVGDSDDAYEVSLNLRTTLDASAVIDLYRQSLLAAGFTEAEQTAPAVALAAQSTFTRSAGDELLVIGVLDRDDLRTVTIGGRLRTTG